MRPLRLTMQAFGPFAGREVVDFRDATSGGLFGVYGPTGAGKSTIFSAMTFALFGEAAKEEQETVSLRSDYASPDMSTEVELVFDVADHRYVIRRRPEQMRPRQRGTGSTKAPHEAWLFDATGMPLASISKDQAGKIVEEKKPGAVRDAVVELLGYGPEQFRQIVLLPQGRFERFLAAKTDLRLAILRELFDVSLYRGLAEKMKGDAAEIEREVRQKREVCAQRLQLEGFESGDALREGVESAQAKSIQQDAHAQQLIAFAKTAGDAVSSAEHIDQKFVANEAAQTALATLVLHENAFRELDSRNRRVRRAETMLEGELHLSEAGKAFKIATLGVANAAKAASTAERAQDSASAALAAEQAKDLEREGLRIEVQQLLQHQQALAKTQRLSTETQQTKSQLAKVTQQCAGRDAALKQLEIAVTTAEQNLENARKNELLRATTGAELTGLLTEETKTRAFDHQERQLTKAKSDLADATSKSDAGMKAAQAVEKQFKEAERRLAEVQALHLAAKLGPGDPCPVCGATEHPKPATGRIEHAGLDEAFRKAKDAYDKAIAVGEQAASHLNLAQASKTVLESTFAELERPQRPLSAVRAAIASAKERIGQLGAPEAVSESKAKLEQVRLQRSEVKAALDKLQGPRTSAEKAAAEASGRLEQALSVIPPHFREPARLERAIDAAKQKLLTSENVLKQSQDLAQTTREAALSAKNYLENAASLQATAKGKLDVLTQGFDKRLSENGLTKEEFSTLKSAVATVSVIEERVTAFYQQLDGARTNAQAAEKVITDVLRPDVNTLRQARDEAEHTAQTATQERGRASARFEQLSKLQVEVTTLLSQLSRLEEESNSLRVLAAMFNAENELRLDLETFAIGAMFDQVIDAANQRLGPMTAGRFTLEREVDAAGGRSRRGLGIRVQDLFTGKPRATSTLSGGETFIAALSLALGLSDVVERTNGRVRLDTIFIDEGFGSLDAENDAGTLDQVLQVLTHLVSEHRSVGLVSHVPLVQEAVPNGFYVRKGMQGSHVEVRGLS